MLRLFHRLITSPESDGHENAHELTGARGQHRLCPQLLLAVSAGTGSFLMSQNVGGNCAVMSHIMREFV
jgi:hypothetical protein